VCGVQSGLRLGEYLGEVAAGDGGDDVVAGGGPDVGVEDLDLGVAPIAGRLDGLPQRPEVG